MAVQVVKGGGVLGGLGTLLGVGGALTGNPLLGTLGAGATAADQLMNGNADAATFDTLGQLLQNIGWKNIAQGNMANQNPNMSQEDQDRLKSWKTGYNWGWR